MKRFLQEVHRRWLWQALLIYSTFSGFAFMVSLQIAERRELPAWFTTFAAVLLIVGLPIVLITAAVQEGIPKVGRSDPTLRVDTEDLSDPDALSLQLEAQGVRRVFTWRNAILGGFVAFIIWALVATAWLITADQLVSGLKERAADEAATSGQ
jgi:hypothetical protein